MSNFFLAVAKPEKAERIRAWLDTYAGQDEYLQSTLECGDIAFIATRGVKECFRGNSFFKGSAFGRRAAILSAVGLAQFERVEPFENLCQFTGSFYSCRFGSDSARVVRDLFGMANLFYTTADGFAAASDSFAVLASLRRHLGLKNTLNEEVILARSLLNNLSCHQLSGDSFVREIEFAVPGQALDVTSRGIELWSQSPDFADSERTYEELLVDTADEIGTVLLAVSDDQSLATNLHLSGGMDSRTVLAALDNFQLDYQVSTGKVAGKINEDYLIAENLAKWVGVKFGFEEPAAPDGPSILKFTNWASSLAGYYDDFGPSRMRDPRPNFVGINGIGGELGRDYWGRYDLEGLVQSKTSLDDIHTEPLQVDAFREQIRKGNAKLSFTGRDLPASKTMYVGYRISAHSLANTLSLEMRTVSPLVTISWMRIGCTENGEEIDPTLDLLTYFNPRLATIPFEGGRYFSSDQLSASLDRVGPLPPVKLDPRIYGNSPSQIWGPSQLGLNIGAELGYSGLKDYQDIKTRALECVDALPGGFIRDTYSRIVKNADWMISKANGHYDAAGPAPAKVASLILLANV